MTDNTATATDPILPRRRRLLTGQIVAACRTRAAAGETGSALAREFGVHVVTMRYAITGENWKHVTVPPVPAGRRPLLTDAIVVGCRTRYAAGETMSALAAEFGVSREALRLAIGGRTWKHVTAVQPVPPRPPGPRGPDAGERAARAARAAARARRRNDRTDRRRQVAALHQAGQTLGQIAAAVGAPGYTVRTDIAALGLDGGPIRRLHGSDRPGALLTDAIVAEARTRYAAGESAPKLAAEYGVTASAMHAAVTGRTWKHVTVPPVSKKVELDDDAQAAAS